MQSTRGLHGGYQLARPAAADQRRADPRCARGTGGAHRLRRRGQPLRHRADLPRRPRLAAAEPRHPPLAAGDLAAGARRPVDAAPARLPALERDMKAVLGRPSGSQPQAGAAMSETAEQLDAPGRRSYQHGFVTDIDADTVAAGPRRGRGAADLAQEGRAAVPARLAPEGAAALAAPCASRTGRTCSYAPIDYQAISYYSAPRQKTRRPEEPRRRRSEAAGDLREARRAAARARAARRRRGGCGVRQRLGGHHLQGAPGRRRRHLLPVLRGGAQPPGAASSSTWAAWCPTPTTSSPR